MSNLKLSKVIDNLAILRLELQELTSGELFVLSGNENIKELQDTVDRAIQLLQGMLNRNRISK